ncbi:DNA polymerase III epsilon subunit-like protein [Salinibacter ruber]|nr:DNA polymerase III epsilon subunit-like protein [Salinibacter ruber]
MVGHNLQFDVRFLTHEAGRLGLSGLDLRFTDTLGLARSLLDVPDTYQLGALLSHFDTAPEEALHTAVGDALATRTLFWHLVEHDSLQTLSDAHVQRLQWGTR